jgi:hypothetical protein
MPLVVPVLAVVLQTAGPSPPAIPLSLGSCAVLQAAPFEVRSLYWELLKHTEVCVAFPGAPPAEGSLPFSFTFSFTYTGTEPKPPAWILFRAQLPPYAVVVTPSLEVSIDGEEPMNLVAPGRPYQLAYPNGCAGADTCGFTGVEVPLTPATFQRMVQARSVRGTAFDTAFAFPADARRALQELARRADLQ